MGKVGIVTGGSGAGIGTATVGRGGGKGRVTGGKVGKGDTCGTVRGKV